MHDALASNLMTAGSVLLVGAGIALLFPRIGFTHSKRRASLSYLASSIVVSAIGVSLQSDFAAGVTALNIGSCGSAAQYFAAVPKEEPRSDSAQVLLGRIEECRRAQAAKDSVRAAEDSMRAWRSRYERESPTAAPDDPGSSDEPSPSTSPWGKSIERQVAADAVKQYEIVQRNGSAIDRCVHAALVAEAYLQAHDEERYREWKKTERSDCSDAGMPK